eukprot:TRINITY_DN978_c0_g1_i20.p1 TRINITY_DN978_c0_g1~~TRINITY_DN978_c0_g1_i20.p1  ORF type:complete len:263 (-),score=41.57 TRINITY_DN978_c0_g1_i20:222-1010(-)
MKLAVFLLAASVAFGNAEYRYNKKQRQWEWYDENEVTDIGIAGSGDDGDLDLDAEFVECWYGEFDSSGDGSVVDSEDSSDSWEFLNRNKVWESFVPSYKPYFSSRPQNIIPETTSDYGTEETTSTIISENEATTEAGTTVTTTTFDVVSTDNPKETSDYDELANNITCTPEMNCTVNILVTAETYEVESDFEFVLEDEEIDIEVEPPVCNSRIYLLVIVILSISLFIISCGVSVTKLTPYFERNLFGARKARKTDKKIQTRI